MPSVDLVCMANSYKHHRRCVAGLRADGGGWVRPVSDRELGELDSQQYRYADRSEPRVLDVIRVGLSEPRPQPHHPENCLIDGSGWQAVQRPASVEYAPVVAGALSRNPLLLGSTGNRVPKEQFRKYPARESLALVQPTDIRWHTELDAKEGRKRPRVGFRLANIRYDLPLTDPAYVRPLTMLEPGEHPAADLWIPRDRRLLFTISLSEPFDGFCYKLVVAVVVMPPAWESFFANADSDDAAPRSAAAAF